VIVAAALTADAPSVAAAARAALRTAAPRTRLTTVF
jgi:hypothetical protein